MISLNPRQLKLSNTGGHRSLVEVDTKEVIQVISLSVPSGIKQHGNCNSSDDLSISEQPERYSGVFGKFEFPNDKRRKDDHESNNQWSEDFGRFPYFG